MSITRWDIAVVSAVAAASAAIFAGPGRGLAVAEGPAKTAPARTTPDFQGCKLTAQPSAEKPGTVVVRATNPGASEVALNAQILIEQFKIAESGKDGKAEMMRRVEPLAKFTAVKVAEQSLNLTVPSCGNAEESLAFTLAPGTYTVSAAVGDKKAALCSLTVPAVQAKDGKK